MCLAILINKVYNKIYNVVSHIRLNYYVSTSIEHIYAIQTVLIMCNLAHIDDVSQCFDNSE